MSCELELQDCINISDVTHKLKMFSLHLNKNYEPKSYLEEINIARAELLKIANRCGCDFNLDTGKLVIK